MLELIKELISDYYDISFTVVEKIITDGCEDCNRFTTEYREVDCTNQFLCPYFLLVEIKIEEKVLTRVPLPFFLKGEVREVHYFDFLRNERPSVNEYSSLSGHIPDWAHEMLERYVVNKETTEEVKEVVNEGFSTWKRLTC